ncbi:MAG: GlsB/YeaQ/YmgE family stress response membrane protein [Planctomycetes bacterium]|nr:GlsB/YeaQ/YmgE family stress response membrane protein [Planctomycetota bacterium]
MVELELSAAAQQWVNVVLIWLGYGILAGLLARTILPGQEPRSAAGTLVIGIGGSVGGLTVLEYVWRGDPITPISPLGFFAAVAGTFVLLAVYRVLAASFVISPKDPPS